MGLGGTTPLPGFADASPTFAQPFDMLLACHARTRRSLQLLDRLRKRIDQHGHDAHTREAAGDVLRYFRKAAPLHHEDEERHVFPALHDSTDSELNLAVDGLQADHARLEALWRAIEPVLRDWAAEPPQAPVEPVTHTRIAEFAQRYFTHMSLEEVAIFPTALAHMNEQSLSAMSADMERRRIGPGAEIIKGARGAAAAPNSSETPAMRTSRRGYLRRRRVL
jgi:hemerythrin-like domain-containing protein